jgi:hypothetical protein
MSNQPASIRPAINDFQHGWIFFTHGARHPEQAPGHAHPAGYRRESPSPWWVSLCQGVKGALTWRGFVASRSAVIASPSHCQG